MAIEFACGNCGRSLHVAERLAGRRGKCPACGGTVQVPAAESVLSPVRKASTAPAALNDERPLSPPAVDAQGRELAADSANRRRKLAMVTASVVAVALVGVCIALWGPFGGTADPLPVSTAQAELDSGKVPPRPAGSGTAETAAEHQSPAESDCDAYNESPASRDDSLEEAQSDSSNDESPSSPDTSTGTPTSPKGTAAAGDDNAPDDKPQEQLASADRAAADSSAPAGSKGPPELSDEEERRLLGLDDEAAQVPLFPMPKGADEGKDLPDEEDEKDCPHCLNERRVPNVPYRPYVHVEGDPRPKGIDILAAQPCPHCRQDLSKEILAELEEERLAKAGKVHLEWERATGMQFTRVETSHAVLHLQAPPAQARVVGQTLEKLTAHLQTQTGSTALTSVPREFMHHLIVRTKPAYLRMIQVCRTRKEFAGSAGEYWRISAMMAGFTGMGVSVSHSDVSAPPELIVHFALQDYALRQVGGASLYGAPDWLVTGFAYYGAYAATGKNLVHRIAYRPNELQLGENWNLELKRIAAAGHLKPWDNLFLLSLADWTSREHVAAYSIVSFLFQEDPKKFLQLVIEFRQEGRRSTEAVEAAYGEKIADLQQQWLRWAAQQQ